MPKIQNSKLIIVNGKKIADNIFLKTKKEINKLKSDLVLAVVLIGDDPASHLYVKIKEKRAQEMGIKINTFLLKNTIKENKIIDLIKKLNQDKNINGIIVQLPLPKKYNSDNIINSIDVKKDVDALKKNSKTLPPTAGAIMEIFRYYKINLKNKNIVIIGYGKLVGKPIYKLLKEKGLKPDVLTEKTKKLEEKTRKADILISCAGVPHLVNEDMVKKGVMIIDAGTSVEKIQDSKFNIHNSKVIGDVDFENVKQYASLITPPVGGVGPITVAKLLENVLISAKRN